MNHIMLWYIPYQENILCVYFTMYPALLTELSSSFHEYTLDCLVKLLINSFITHSLSNSFLATGDFCHLPLQRDWNQIRMLVLIRIQTVKHSDSVPERIFEKVKYENLPSMQRVSLFMNIH